MKKVKIDSLNNDRLMLVAVLKNLKENVEIQMFLKQPMMEILEVRVCATVKEGNNVKN
jgi:hypothetical protein